MKKRSKFKVLSFVMMFMMIFSNSVFAKTTNSSSSAKNNLQIKQLAKEQLLKQLKTIDSVAKEQQDKLHSSDNSQIPSASSLDQDAVNVTSNRLDLYKDTDKVRVIIEVQGDTLADYASKQKTSIANLPDRANIEKNIKAAQDKVKDAIKAKNLNIKVRYSFNAVNNGFSAEVSKKDLENIKLVPGVKKVTVANVYYPDMNTATSFTEAAQVWEDLNYKGEGMVVAVIDSGIDWRHNDLKDIDASKIKLTSDEVNAKINDGEKGKFFTNKVPVGWNWADNNNEVIDLYGYSEMHGMHVAGIIGANGDPANGGIKGVAPQAQLLAEKVFTNRESDGAYTDDLVAAINHAVEFNADVLNMSLGSTAGFVLPDDPEQSAITKATELGVICVVSAGNSAYTTYGYDLPMAINPDTGVVGSPGLIGSSVQVAASNNLLTLYEHNITVNGTTYVGFGKDLWVSSAEVGQTMTGTLVSLGTYDDGTPKLGYPEDYEGIDVTGKIVLVKRGVLSFFDKAKYAAEKGAKAIICYDHGLSTFYKDQGKFAIPFMMISKEDGASLESAIAAGSTAVEVSFKSKSIDGSSGRPTSFSSWGPTPNLEFKPDIMAPGGSITSLANNNKYQDMSGTSMSAPHVAGGMALIKEGLEAKGVADVTPELAKIIAMNTAEPVLNSIGYEYQPRLQGAGMMKIKRAIETPVYITDEHHAAGVSLKEIGDTASFKLTLKNMTETEQAYNVNGTIATDYIYSDGYNSLYSHHIDTDLMRDGHSGTITSDVQQVTVPASGTAEVTVTVNINSLPKNTFVEGFVYFTPVSGNAPRLNVPYIGFYGDWNEPNIIDPVYTGHNGNEVYYGYTGLLSEIDTELYYSNAFSPNGDSLFDYTLPIVSMLRNAKDFVVSVKDSDGNVIRRVDASEFIKKQYDLDQGKPPYRFYNDWAWNGKNSKGQIVADGIYDVELKTRIQYENAEWQTVDLPVMVDNTAPAAAITKVDGLEAAATINDDDGNVSLEWSAEDSGSGIASTSIAVFEKDSNGNYTGKYETYGIESGDSYEFELPYKINAVSVGVMDNALNFNESQELTITNTTVNYPHERPMIVITSPVQTEILGTRTVHVEGYVDTDRPYDGVLKIDNKDVNVKGNNSFSTDITYTKDGWNVVNVEAYYPGVYNPDDPSTLELRTIHAVKVLIDTTVPTISLDWDNIKDSFINGETNLVLHGKLKDETSIGNKLTANEDTVINSSLDDFTTIDQAFEYTVPVNSNNQVVLTASDLAGNTSKIALTYKYKNGYAVINDGKTDHNVSKLNAELTGLGLSAGTLSPVFSSTKTSYTASVGADVTSIKITPTAALPTSVIKVNGTEVASGTESAPITLVGGTNRITVQVTAADGRVRKSYTVTVNKAKSNISTLDNLQVNVGGLSFNAETKDYTLVDVENSQSTIKVTPTATIPGSTIKVNGKTVKSGVESSDIKLNVGENTIKVEVTSEDKTSKTTYTIKVNRKKSSNANLTSLTLSNSARLSPDFSAGVTSYTASVSNRISSIRVTPKVQDSTATITVNDKAVSSGRASGLISLEVGDNFIYVVVTAQDGTTKTYSITVTRAAQ